MWLLFKKDMSKEFELDKHVTYLFEIEKINFLAGQNNGGKSYFLRNILSNTVKVFIDKDSIISELKKINVDKDYQKISYDDINKLEINNFNEVLNNYMILTEQLKMIQEDAKPRGGIQYGMGYSGGLQNKTQNSYTIGTEDVVQLLSTFNIPIPSNDKCYVTFDEIYYQIETYRNNIWKKMIEDFLEELENIDETDLFKFGDIIHLMGIEKKYEDRMNIEEIFKFYIPIFRSIRHPLKKVNEKTTIDNLGDIYKDRVMNEYRLNEDEIKVFTGLDLYFDFKQRLLGNKSERKKVNEFEKFISTHFFNGKDLTIVPDEETFELKIDIENDHDLFFYQVGDGISSLIIMLYYCFMSDEIEDKPKILCIEEPESNFHPGFQRLFINIISYYQKFKNFVFIFTTHSNHLIDIGVSEYKNALLYLANKEENKIHISKTNDRLLVNNTLEVKSTSVCIANKVIWIEGKYDALYIRLLLTLKNINDEQKNSIEDYDYCYLPYAGANIVNIDFSLDNDEGTKQFISKATSINPNYILIMDDDGIENQKNGAKYKRYLSLKEKLGNNLYKLKVREIENIFPETIVKGFISSNIKEITYDGKKYSQNEIVELMEIKYDDYKNKKLGNYINSKLKKLFPTLELKTITGRENGFSTKSGENGFLYDKELFHTAVTEWFNNEQVKYDSLPEETQDLIDFVDKFIRK